MFKTYLTTILTILFLVTGFNSTAQASVKKHKKRSAKSSHIKSGKRRSARHSKSSRLKKHHASSVDLKAITTESPYAENPANGVNSIETKPGIQ
jgi:hypothetical protein